MWNICVNMCILYVFLCHKILFIWNKILLHINKILLHKKTQENISHHINGHIICTNSNILISYVSHMLTYMQHMSHHLSDTCVFVFWKCPNLCLQYVWCSVFICCVCGTDMFSIMNSLWCFAFSKCFVYAQSKWFTYTHQMFYMCRSNDGMSHGNKTVSVHMEFIMCTWFVYHSRPPTHIRKDTCNIYAPCMQNISLFASWYMIHIW